eukprot:Lithocolla_globosa_v1_NODE_2777_length_1871_cov_14.307269.p3 type:complete len:148 gc:universal NODE_2777_length_1871_cov_14.307269:1310-867(-)
MPFHRSASPCAIDMDTFCWKLSLIHLKQLASGKNLSIFVSFSAKTPIFISFQCALFFKHLILLSSPGLFCRTQLFQTSARLGSSAIVNPMMLMHTNKNLKESNEKYFFPLRNHLGQKLKSPWPSQGALAVCHASTDSNYFFFKAEIT